MQMSRTCTGKLCQLSDLRYYMNVKMQHVCEIEITRFRFGIRGLDWFNSKCSEKNSHYYPFNVALKRKLTKFFSFRIKYLRYAYTTSWSLVYTYLL
jgi:hypothetical protein